MSGVVVVNQPGVYLVDADGNVITLVDGAAIGSAEALVIAGKDGSNARMIRVASDGTVRTDPTGTTAQPITDNGGSLTVDGSISVSNFPAVQPVSDNAGSLTVDTPQLPSSLVGSRLDVNNGAWLGSTAPTVGQKTMANSLPVAISSDQQAIPITTSGAGEEATYTAVATAVTVGNNKSMLGLLNPSGSGYIIKLREYYVRNAQTTAVTGVAGVFELHPIRAGTPGITAGTDVTPTAHDSADALPSGLVCKTGGTVAGETSTLLDVMRISTDEWGPGTLDVEGHNHGFENYMPARVKRDSVQKAFIARPGEGLHLKFATNSTAGSFDILFIFTKVNA
jgi:hypothetical protein